MNIPELLAWVLRAFGVLYLLGGIWGIRQGLVALHVVPAISEIEHRLAEMSAPGGNGAVEPPRLIDGARNWWLFTGACILVMAGFAMALALHVCVYFLVAILIHQMLYFVRQRRRELRATSPEEAEAERPNKTTVNGFYVALLVTVLAAWLSAMGALI